MQYKKQLLSIEQVVGEYQSRLKAFLHTRVGNAADVDDLLQEVLIKVHTNLPALRQTDSIQGWLYQIAHRTVIDYYRKSEPATKLVPDDFWQEQNQKAGVIGQLSHCIEPLVQALPNEYAELLTAIDLEGRPQKEYAQSRGIHYSTFKSRVQKARQKLHELFQNCCQFSLDTNGNIMDYEQRKSGCKNC